MSPTTSLVSGLTRSFSLTLFKKRNALLSKALVCGDTLLEKISSGNYPRLHVLILPPTPLQSNAPSKKFNSMIFLAIIVLVPYRLKPEEITYPVAEQQS